MHLRVWDLFGDIYEDLPHGEHLFTTFWNDYSWNLTFTQKLKTKQNQQQFVVSNIYQKLGD